MVVKKESETKTFIDIEDTNHCFICGPQDMIFLIRNHLEEILVELKTTSKKM